MASCAADTSGTCSAVTPSAQRNTATCLIMGPTLLEARVGAAVDRDVGAGDEAGLLGAQEGDDRPEVAGVAQEPDRHAGRRTRRVAAVEGPDPEIGRASWRERVGQ